MPLAPGNPKTIRTINRRLVLDLIREHELISRAELARRTKLTRATVSDVVADLLALGLVREAADPGPSQGVGRKPIPLQYVADAGALVGIDVGGSNVAIGVSDLRGRLLHKGQFPSANGQSRDDFLRALIGRIDNLLRAAGLGRKSLHAIGVASPGLVVPETGVVQGLSPNLPDWHDLPLRDYFSAEFGVPVAVENDVNAALMGEAWHGAGRGCNNLVFVVLSTGIGGAVMINGQMYRGTRGAAGEVGFFLFGSDTLEGNWGERGCFECLASGGALTAQARERHGLPDAAALFAAAAAGNPEATAAVAEFTRLVAIAITNMVSLLDPDLVIIGGGVAHSQAQFLPRVREWVHRHAPVRPEISVAALGTDAGMVGALVLARQAAIAVGTA